MWHSFVVNKEVFMIQTSDVLQYLESDFKVIDERDELVIKEIIREWLDAQEEDEQDRPSD